MKNPYLLGLVWTLCFLVEIAFPWGRPHLFWVPWGSFFVLGYGFFRLSSPKAFCLSCLAFLCLSAFTLTKGQAAAGIFLLYAVVWSLRRKTFSDNILAKAMAVFLATAVSRFLSFAAWEGLSSISSLFVNPWMPVFYLLYNFLLAVFLFWILEEKGEIVEERWFTFHAKRGQLNLFGARELKRARNGPIFKKQKRIRKRFGLQNSW